MSYNILYLIIGLIAGISMGSVGIGAGIITMPLLIYSGLSIKQAVAAIMVMQLLPQSAPGVYNYWKDISWKPTIIVILGSIFGIWLGSYLVNNKYLTNQTLYRIITVFLFMSSICFYFNYWHKT